MSPADTPADIDGSHPAAREPLVVPAAGSKAPATERCPGCGAVLVVVPGLTSSAAGASPSCSGLFDVTVRGLRDEAAADVQTAGLLQLATDAYAAQHLQPGHPATPAARLCLWVARGLDPLRGAEIAGRLDEAAPRGLSAPQRWTTTVADVAADLDVVDLPSLVRSWAGAVWADWSPAQDELCAAADAALGTRP
ncbi:MAG TPA: DUF5946 family protein [Modestobacter sp.]|nr:DUF5946 family protein [Modestobacter sp.]